MRRLVLATVFVAGCSAGGSAVDNSRYYLRADLSLTDGRSLTFDQPAQIFRTSDSPDVSVQASDPLAKNGLGIEWRPQHVTTTGTYNTVFGSNVDISLEYVDTAGKKQDVATSSGRLTFVQLDTQTGGVVAGTFSNLQFVEVTSGGVATSNVVGTVADGSFRAAVP